MKFDWKSLKSSLTLAVVLPPWWEVSQASCHTLRHFLRLLFLTTNISSGHPCIKSLSVDRWMVKKTDFGTRVSPHVAAYCFAGCGSCWVSTVAFTETSQQSGFGRPQMELSQGPWLNVASHPDCRGAGCHRKTMAWEKLWGWRDGGRDGGREKGMGERRGTEWKCLRKKIMWLQGMPYIRL